MRQDGPVTEPRIGRPGRLDAFGTTIFAEMSARALELGAVNLGQGFPDEPGPSEVLEAAERAIEHGHNQYAPGRGVPDLVRAIAEHEALFYGRAPDPNEILVTAGATEAIAATVLALCGPGDEVVTFEPFYDSYGAMIELAGASKRTVALRHPHWEFDPAELRAAITPRTRLVLVNTPHNPTGRVFRRGDLEAIAEVCLAHDLLAVTDEVYEHLVFAGAGAPLHERLADIDGMGERTITISSAGKTFSTTGWKIGWIIAAPRLVASITAVKQFLTFTSGTPLQYGIAAGLSLPRERFDAIAATLQEKRDLFCNGLRRLGWPVNEPEATYFCSIDLRELGAGKPGREFCGELIERVGVAAIPMSIFYDEEHVAAGENLVRFAFCKRREVLEEALERLARW